MIGMLHFYIFAKHPDKMHCFYVLLNTFDLNLVHRRKSTHTFFVYKP